MRVFSLSLSLLFFCCGLSTAVAASVTERIKERGVVTCGSVGRPGLASRDSQGQWHGLEVDICRAVAVAVLGSPEKIQYHTYESASDFDAVRHHDDDISFLTGSEIHAQDLAGHIVPGPTVFVESYGVLVAGKSAARHVDDLAGDSICFFIGSPAERGLNSYFEKKQRSWFRRPFSEDGEMLDTYAVQNCHALAGEVTELAESRINPEVARLASRILPESLSDFPIIAATGTEDGRWSAIVAWTIHTLISADRPEARWYAGGANAMPIIAPDLGLEKGWQQRMVQAVGNYGDIFTRNLGTGSALKIDRGLNENHLRGGLSLSPFID
jgi:general L-amino acid transport system substrate-binding protein